MKKYLALSLISIMVLTGCSLFNKGGQSSGPINIKSAKDGQFQISKITVEKPGFVIFYADNGAGQPGKIVGQSSLLTQGDLSDIVVGSSKIEKGKTYFAMLHYDDGDQAFLIANDRPTLDDQGKPIVSSIVAD